MLGGKTLKARKIAVTITLLFLLIILSTLPRGTTALAYNPFIPDYDDRGFPGLDPREHLSADNVDFVLTGKKTGAELRNNIDFTDIRDHWAKEHIFKMAAQSVIRGYGNMRFSPEGSISRQEALAVLVRIMGREEEVQRRAAAGGMPPAGSSATDLWAREYITLAQDIGILDIGEGGGAWEGNANRQEVAVWLARALRLAPVYGADQQYLYNLNDWRSISLPNQPLVEAILREDIMQGDDRGYFNPGAGLRRSEIAVMLDRVAEKFYSLRNLTAYSGEIIQRGTLDGDTAFSIRSPDGTRGLITLSGGTDFPVLRMGAIGSGDSLQPGDRVEILGDNEGILYALVPRGSAAEVYPSRAEGYVRAVDPANNRLSITDYDGNVHTYRYDDNVGVTINDRPAGVKDLKFGLEVTFDLIGERVATIRSSYAMEQPGYIPPGGRVRTGRIVEIGADSLILGLDNGGQEDFSISNSTMITKEGTMVPAGSIKVGDRVRVYTDTVLSNIASRINIEGKQQLIQDVYRGVLEAVHPSGGTLVLRETAAFINGDWEDRERRITLELGPGTQIYYGGRALSPDDIKSGFFNATAYVAISSNFGNPRAVMVTLKRGSEQLYGGRIRDISWGTGEIELRDRNNIMLNEASIILSGGRIVDISALDEDHTVTVVADRYDGVNNAAIVMLEDVHPTGDRIYVGRLDEIRTREFDINYYSRLEQNEWDRLSSRSRFQTFEYDRDTYIMKIEGNRVETLSAGDFFQGDYAEDRSTRSRRDYYAFIMADGDRARAIRMMRGGILKDGSTIDNVDLEGLRVTMGEIRDINTVRDILTISKASNWSSFYRQWERSDADNYVNYATALIIRDGRVIEAGDLKRGESVYVIRDDNRGIIIMTL